MTNATKRGPLWIQNIQLVNRWIQEEVKNLRGGLDPPITRAPEPMQASVDEHIQRLIRM